MRIPLMRSGGDDTPYAWWEWLFAPIMWPLFTIGIIGLALLSGFLILTIPFQLYYSWSCKRRFTELMKSRGRYIPWHELKPRLLAGEGSLVVELGPTHGIQVWWTPDGIDQDDTEKEIDLLFLEPSPFVNWCFGVYLHPDCGKAFFTQPPYVSPNFGFFGLNDPYTPGFVDKSFFTKRFPKMRVVMTVEPFPPK